MNRNRRFLPYAALVVGWLAFAAYVWISAGQLPERVATHFGANGVPNGWMTREGHVHFTLLMGLILPAFVLGIFGLIRLFQGKGLNVPNKDYWLSPERRQETLDFIQRQGIRFAGLFIAFLAGIHWSILAANRHVPTMLPTSYVGWIAGGFLVAAAIWILIFFRYFFRKPA